MLHQSPTGRFISLAALLLALPCCTSLSGGGGESAQVPRGYAGDLPGIPAAASGEAVVFCVDRVRVADDVRAAMLREAAPAGIAVGDVEGMLAELSGHVEEHLYGLAAGYPGLLVYSDRTRALEEGEFRVTATLTSVDLVEGDPGEENRVAALFSNSPAGGGVYQCIVRLRLDQAGVQLASATAEGSTRFEPWRGQSEREATGQDQPEVRASRSMAGHTLVLSTPLKRAGEVASERAWGELWRNALPGGTGEPGTGTGTENDQGAESGSGT